MNDLILKSRTRLDLYKTFDKIGYKQGVEIGVLRGLNSEEILLNSKIKLYSIDHWHNNDKSELSNFEDYIHTVARLFRFGDQSVVINNEGHDTSKLFKENSVDFVYIDAGLTPTSYYEMIMDWWPKVREGGIMCGHLFELINDGVTIRETDVANLALERFIKFMNRVITYRSHRLHIVLNRDIPPTADVDSYKGSKSWIINKPVVSDIESVDSYNKSLHKDIRYDI